MRIKNFNQYINEAEDLENLARLRDLGMIEPHEYRAGARDLGRNAMMAAAERGEHPSSALPDIKAALESPEADLLRARGLEMVSSRTQLLNGNIIWAKPGYTKSRGWGLGFFADIRVVRRMTPKGVTLTYMRPIGSMDIIMKRFDNLNIQSNLDFYKIAMKWANDHINWEQVDAAEQKGDPKEWRYYVKEKTKRGYFEN